MKELFIKFKAWFVKERWLFRWIRSSTVQVPEEVKESLPEVNFEPTTPIVEEVIKPMSNREKLYITALSCINTDVTPDDTTPDNVACAEVVNKIHKIAFGDEIGGGVSTYSLYYALKDRTDFTKVTEPLEGDIIISPTGLGNGRLSNGHVGYVGKNQVVMSNASSTGLLDTKYTLTTWKERYVDIGGFPMVYFRKL